MIDAIREYLAQENLVLCRSNDTQFAIDGVREVEVLHAITQAIVDTWDDDVTVEIPASTIDHLRALSVA